MNSEFKKLTSAHLTLVIVILDIDFIPSFPKFARIRDIIIIKEALPNRRNEWRIQRKTCSGSNDATHE